MEDSCHPELPKPALLQEGVSEAENRTKQNPESGKTHILNSHRIESVSVSVSLDRIHSKQIRKCVEV